MDAQILIEMFEGMSDTRVLQIEVAVIGLLNALAVAAIGAMFRHDSKKRLEALEDARVRAALRAEESMWMLKLSKANMKLSRQIIKAFKNKKTNGETDDALNEAKQIEAQFDEFVAETAIGHITK